MMAVLPLTETAIAVGMCILGEWKSCRIGRPHEKIYVSYMDTTLWNFGFHCSEYYSRFGEEGKQMI